MSPRTPTFTQALLHFLVAAMGIVYLVAAGIQINRGNHTEALLDLIIAAGITFIVHKGSMAQGRVFSNFTMRRTHKSLKREEMCAWCHEDIEANTPAISHRGAYKGDLFLLHHHPECEKAVYDWYKTNADESATDAPYPQVDIAQRGRPARDIN